MVKKAKTAKAYPKDKAGKLPPPRPTVAAIGPVKFKGSRPSTNDPKAAVAKAMRAVKGTRKSKLEDVEI